jgi:hypothetical protein
MDHLQLTLWFQLHRRPSLETFKQWKLSQPRVPAPSWMPMTRFEAVVEVLSESESSQGTPRDSPRSKPAHGGMARYVATKAIEQEAPSSLGLETCSSHETPNSQHGESALLIDPELGEMANTPANELGSESSPVSPSLEDQSSTSSVSSACSTPSATQVHVPAK